MPARVLRHKSKRRKVSNLFALITENQLTKTDPKNVARIARGTFSEFANLKATIKY